MYRSCHPSRMLTPCSITWSSCSQPGQGSDDFTPNEVTDWSGTRLWPVALSLALLSHRERRKTFFFTHFLKRKDAFGHSDGDSGGEATIY